MECIQTIICDQGAIRAVRFNVSGSYCMTCGSDKKIKLWNPYRNLLLQTYGGHSDDVLDVAGSCDSSQIISGSKDKSVIVWDVSTSQALKRLRGHASGVTCIALNEDSSVALSGSKDNTVCCWDLKSGNRPMQVFADAKDCITSIRATNNEILTSSVDNAIRIYDIRNGKLITDFLGDPITCASYSRDNQCVLASCSNNSVRLLERISGELLCEYTGHKTDDISIESGISADDKVIISGSVSGEIYLWDLVSARVQERLRHEAIRPVHSLSIHPTKDLMLSASVISVKLWGTGNKDNGNEGGDEQLQ